MRLGSCRFLTTICAFTFLGFAAAPLAGVPGKTAAVQDAWKTYERKDSHFSVALPAGWKVVELDPERIDASLDEIGEANPALGQAFGPQVRGLVRTGVKFMALDTKADFSEGLTNLNVIFNPKPVSLGIEQYLAEGVAELEGLAGGKGKVAHALIEVDGHRAGRLQTRIVVDAAQRKEVAITQVYVLAHGGSLVFTFTTPASQSARHDPVFAGIIQRFRILG